MSIEKVEKWYNHCREVCYLSYIKNQEKIGGKDQIVEIGDIILSSNKIVGNMIIFGGIARNSKKCFALNVKSTKKVDILQKLVHYVLPGSKIISSYSFFKEFKNLGYSSESVNSCPRSVSPKDPSIHILNLFRMWRSLKEVYVKSHTDLCLYTFLYFNKNKLILANERFLPFLKDISDLYPVYKVKKIKVEEE